MLLPLGWLKDYVSWDMDLETLCERLTLGGLEVTGVEQIGEEWDRTKVWVGEVVAICQHPNADRLVLVTVNYGEGELEVVTGAPNLKVGDAGQKVVFAMVGARLIDGYSEKLKYKTLKKGKIRGVPSLGMVCSEKELGISDSHEGIIILPDDAPTGTPFADYWGDTVLDLDLTPNLARCFSVVGVARELAALTEAPFAEPQFSVQADGAPAKGQAVIRIEAPDLCPRFSAALIKDVTIKPSPQWMQRRLIMAGMRPINNIVDITNYVMLEMGQPLHAYDYGLVRSEEAAGPPTLIARQAVEGEELTTLDGSEHTMIGEELLIADGVAAVGFAGVMGGLESEVSDETVDVLLEAANFHNISVRRTSARHKLPSEAAQRFGRGVDREQTINALRRASELMRTLADGTVAEGMIDVYPNKWEPRQIDLAISEVPRILGITLSQSEIAAMLEQLGFETKPVGDAVLRVVVPSFRLDVEIPADLLEEVARIYGYDRLPMTIMAEEIPAQAPNTGLALEERARDVLAGAGLAETMTYSLINIEALSRLDPEGAPVDPAGYLQLANPLSREHEYMRHSLMDAALDTMRDNLRFQDRVALFEIARVYLPREGQLLPDEPSRLCIAMTGPRVSRSWMHGESDMVDFYDLKGVVQDLCLHLGVDDVTYAPGQHSALHPGRTAQLTVAGQPAGVLGEVHPVVRANFYLPDQTVCLAELDLDLMISAAQPVQRYARISKMPTLKLDLAVVVDESVPSDEIGAAILEHGGNLLVGALLFDVYRGEQIGAGKKSLAYSLTFQSPTKTLKSNQANKQRDRIVRALAKAFGAVIRS